MRGSNYTAEDLQGDHCAPDWTTKVVLLRLAYHPHATAMCSSMRAGPVRFRALAYIYVGPCRECLVHLMAARTYPAPQRVQGSLNVLVNGQVCISYRVTGSCGGNTGFRMRNIFCFVQRKSMRAKNSWLWPWQIVVSQQPDSRSYGHVAI